MVSILQRSCYVIAIIGVSIIIFGAICYIIGARVNTTKSINVGLYWVSNAPITKGVYVMFCPPSSKAFQLAKLRGYIIDGFCPNGYGYMMKRVLAMANDKISISPAGVYVNGYRLAHSKPFKTDSAGRLLPRFQSKQYTLGDTELLLMSDVSDTSFDGRYFGPINRMQVKNVIRPVITW